METDPVAVDLNVDAALVLQDMVGIDSYPQVLALMPNIFDEEDARRVRAVVQEQLTEAGIIDGDLVHPRIAEWLRCLERPDVELEARLIDHSEDADNPNVLRMSLVRQGTNHVMAVRCDDYVVVQKVFHEGRSLDILSAALRSALGSARALQFEPFSTTVDQLADLPTDLDECRRVLKELGAVPHTANVLTRVTEEVLRRGEVLMTEHRDGGSGAFRTPSGVGILDTLSGRLITTPSMAMDGQLWSTYRPGDDAAIHAGVVALTELLPSHSWFDSSRTA
ncbi:ESX secretion-associated protein EspG [Nocardia paucivorans]|uniref:ESX secretion-associated protein EspG n=1 Tax=Nocardia paucivorans TaxID=114259 RepID=UPI0002DB5B8C|nr:ESX secretion-associated protein EspG [Nocardia paucivorans]